MSTINKPLLRKWVKALRSGKYQQGQNALRNVYNEFCCLGVLCDIHPQVIWSDELVYSDKYTHSFNGHNSGFIGSLSDKMLKEIGISDRDQAELFELNDNHQVSFVEIAGLLEALYLWD